MSLYEVALDEVGDTHTVIAGTGTYDTAHSVGLTKEAADVGVDAIALVSMAGALALGEYAAGAVVADGQAEQCARAHQLDAAAEQGLGRRNVAGILRVCPRDPRKRERHGQHDDLGHEEDEPPRKKRAEPADEDEPPRRASKPATVVAPATRSSPPSRVKVKASEAAIARRLGVSIEEYARQKAALEGNR